SLCIPGYGVDVVASYIQYEMYTAESWPRFAIFLSSLGANHNPWIHLSNDSRASRRSTTKGTTDSGAIIPSACSGLFSRCVPQNGQFSVTTLSSRSTIAPHAV